MSSHWTNSSPDDPSSPKFGQGLTTDQAADIARQQQDLGRKVDVPLSDSCPPDVADAYRRASRGG